MDTDALDLALEPGNKHSSDTEAINTKCDIQDHYDKQMSNFYNIRITNICSLSQDSHNYSSSTAQLFDWGELASNDPDSNQRSVKCNNFGMISKVEGEDNSEDSNILFVSPNNSDSRMRKASKVKAGDNSMDSDILFISSNNSHSGMRKTSKVKAGDNSVDSDILFISSNNSDSGMRKTSKVKAGDNSVDSDILFISSNNSDSGMTKVALYPLDNAAKSQLSSLNIDRGQRNKDNLSTDDPENRVCDTEVLECLHGTTCLKKKHRVVRSPLKKVPVVMNQYNTPVLINDAMQEVSAKNKIDEDRSNVQTVKNPEESSNVFCCLFGWSAQVYGRTLQCSCESRHKVQAIDSSTKYDRNLESKDCTSVKVPITQSKVSTTHATAGMQYHRKTSKGKCKTTSAVPCSKYTQLEGHGPLGSSSRYKSEIGTTSKKVTRTKQKKKTQTAKNRSTCVTTIKKSHK